MRLSLRYDMRNPPWGSAAADMYRASVEQVAWADRLGFDVVYLAEHHGADDGYCPSPMIQAAAMLGVSSQIRLHFSALLAPLHDPIRLAEDLAVLDLISNGRVEVTLGLGYRPHEYRMFGIDKRKRVQQLEYVIGILEQAWTGEPFEYRGEQFVVRPRPVQRPRPPLYIGGSTEASAIRAARFGDGYLPAGLPGLWEIYEAECARLGRPVGRRPAKKGPLFLHVTDDPERDWPIVAPHVIYTAQSNHEWSKERGSGATPYPAAQSVDDLRNHPSFKVITPEQCVDWMLALTPEHEVGFQPLMGGMPIDVAWASLNLFESKVLPALRAAGAR